jgi:PAS domain S-box-containing protein
MTEPRIDLLEAEELRKAIAGGEVDAFVVGREEGSQRVLLLANAYQRYRQMVEAMYQGAVTTSLEGNILYANQRFADILGMPLARLYTAPLQSYVALADRDRLTSFIAGGRRGTQLDIAFGRDGATVPTRLSVAAFDGYASLLVTDLRPLEWAGLAVEALDSIRNSLEQLNDQLRVDPPARQALDNISEQINGLAQLIDSLHAEPGRVDPRS